MARRKVDLGDISSDLQPFAGQGLSGMIGTEQNTIVPGDEHTLSSSEADELNRCEFIIERGLKTFFEVGAAMLRVRDLRLYRTQYETFEDYCTQRWGMSRPHAYRLIDAAQVQVNLSPIGDKLPTNEAQARPLTRLQDPEHQRSAWQQAVETAPDGRITAAHVEQVVKEMLRELNAAQPGEPTIIEHAPAGAESAPAAAEEPVAETGDPDSLRSENAALRQRLANVQTIIEEYQEHITRAQQYKPTSEQDEVVLPLLRALERVWIELQDGTSST